MDLQTLFGLTTLVGEVITTISLLYLMQTAYKNASCITRSMFAVIIIAFLSGTYIHMTTPSDVGSYNVSETLITVGSAVWFGWRALNEALVGHANQTVFRI